MTSSALSPNEQWLWLVEQLEPGSIARTTATLGRRLRGPLDVARLRECVTELVRRHETLRTTVVVRDGRLERVVSDDPSPEWIWHDLTPLPADEREPLGLRMMDVERLRHFDLGQGVQTRCFVAKLSDTEHLMLFATHHLAADAPSLVLLEQELSGLYTRGISADNVLEPAAAQYTDFASWQASRLRSAAPEALDYWTSVVTGARRIGLNAVFGPPVATAPAGYTMTVVPRGLEDRQQAPLGTPVSGQVHDLVRTSRCSLFMVLLTALQVLLYVRSGQRSFLIRTPSANRIRPEHRTMIGALETHIFVKCEADVSLRFVDVLHGVRRQVMTGLRQQGLPMSLVLGAALRHGGPASQDVALAGGMVQFALFTQGRMAPWAEELEVSVCAGSRIGTPADLQVFAMEEGRRLDGAPPGIVLEANNPGGVYPASAVQQFLATLRDLVAAIAARPESTLAQLRAALPPLPEADPPPEPSTPDRREPVAGEDTMRQRLLATARTACGDDTIRVDDSLFRRPEQAIDTGVRLVDALAGAVGTRKLTIVDLLENPTVAGLAAALAGDRAVGAVLVGGSAGKPTEDVPASAPLRVS